VQTSFFIRVRPLPNVCEIGIPSLLSIFPYQPAKPPAEFQAEHVIFKGFHAGITSLNDVDPFPFLVWERYEEEIQPMMSRAFRPTAAILSILLLSGAPTHAAPVAISEVIQVLGSYQNPPELRLRGVSQHTSSLVDEGEGPSPVASAAQQSAAGGVAEMPDATTADLAPSDTLLSGVAVSADPQAGVDVVDQGDVEGTICDCGEIWVPGGGFPKWPLLFLAAIPFFFIHGCEDCEVPTPGITPPSEVIPEPASLLLFGTSLAAFGASLRRRYAKGKLAAQVQTTGEG
jgi:PEP-CTERM motif-containing protein